MIAVEQINPSHRSVSDAVDTGLPVAYDDFLLDQLLDAAEQTAEALKHGNKLLIAVDGVCSEEAQELAYRLVETQAGDSPAIRAIALSTDLSAIMPAATTGCDSLFKYQVEAFADPGDVFLGMSLCGQYRNVIAAVRECRTRGVLTIGFTGQNANLFQGTCDYTLSIPSGLPWAARDAYFVLHETFSKVVDRHIVGSQYFEGLSAAGLVPRPSAKSRSRGNLLAA